MNKTRFLGNLPGWIPGIEEELRKEFPPEYNFPDVWDAWEKVKPALLPLAEGTYVPRREGAFCPLREDLEFLRVRLSYCQAYRESLAARSVSPFWDADGERYRVCMPAPLLVYKLISILVYWVDWMLEEQRDGRRGYADQNLDRILREKFPENEGG